METERASHRWRNFNPHRLRAWGRGRNGCGNWCGKTVSDSGQRDLKLYILCGKKNIAFERKEIESREPWCVSTSFPWGKNKRWFIALASVYGVNHRGLISSYQRDLSEWSWEETHSRLPRARVSQLQIPIGVKEGDRRAFWAKVLDREAGGLIFFSILVKRFCFNFKCTWLYVWGLLYYYFKRCSCTQRGHIISGF